jgi:hypothetical protein
MNEPVSRRAVLRGAGAILTLPLLEQSTLLSVLADTADVAPLKPEPETAMYRGRWYDASRCFGFHHDLHVLPSDRDIGAQCNPKELAEMLKLTGADFVQTDSKGHPGLTSWFSKTPGASVGPGVVKDPLLVWRAATKQLGLPLHCHYSGICDISAGNKHPEWCVVGPDGKPVGMGFASMVSAAGGKMCPRSPYVDELMIPQLMELIDRYDVDGFWIDGDLWAVQPCYCNRCRAAFKAKTGIAEPPKAPGDPHWAQWWNFTRESFEQYVTRYCDAVHRHKPGVLVCSNWLQTLRNPGPPTVPTDWISGDNTPVWGVDNCRCEARFISTRGKPWDIMMWCFYSAHGQLGRTDWVMKPVEMLQQEAAVIVAMGGNVQTCENPFGGVRNGRLVPWRMRRIGELARFVKSRHALCHGAETIPQIAVLHSEHHVRSAPGGDLSGSIDVAPVQGAVYSLLECHYGVDILDEWALRPRLAQFPVVVVPEQDRLSEKMVEALKDYVRAGGKLLISGTAAFDRFGGPFLGVKGSRVATGTYFLPAADGVIPICTNWRLLDIGEAKSLAKLGTTLFRDEQLLPNPAATLNCVGRGAVGYIPCNIFREFTANRYPLVRVFVADVLRALAGKMEIAVDAPTCVDVVLRRKGAKRVVHLINRSSGIPNLPNSAVIDEIPPVGPITIAMDLPRKPKKVYLAFEDSAVKWDHAPGQNARQLKIDVATVHIHAAVVVEEEV